MTYYLESEAGYGRDQPYMIRLVNGKVGVRFRPLRPALDR